MGMGFDGVEGDGTGSSWNVDQGFMRRVWG